MALIDRKISLAIMKALQIGFTDKEITPWGGMALLGQMLAKMDFGSVLSEIDLPVQGSNRGYPPRATYHQLFGRGMVWSQLF